MPDHADVSTHHLDPHDLGRQLLDSLRLPDREIEQRIDQALSASYWQTLVPGLIVGGAPAPELSRVASLETQARRDVLHRFEAERYMRLPQLLPQSLTSRMHDGVHAVLNADWPAVFTWVFDEFWRVPRLPALVDLLSAVLGDGYKQTPYIWTNMVSAQRGAGGWSPHVDNPGPDARVTMWIPLSDATLDTGCISLIPPNAIPSALQVEWHDRTSFDVREMKQMLQASRAIVSTPGDVMAWDAGVIHWGSPRQAAGQPRVSLSTEFITPRGEARILAQSIDVAPDAALPSHEQRLRLIADGILMFNRRELRTSRYEGFATRLLARLSDG